MENAEPHAEHLGCRISRDLSSADPPGTFLLSEDKPEHRISSLRPYPKPTVQRGSIEGSRLKHKLELNV